MGWLTVAWTVVSHLPDMLKMLKSIVDFVHEIEDRRERAEKIKELNAGLQQAHKEKDTSGLEKIFNPSASNPSGVPPGV